jgi:phosphoserine phosphatase
MPTLLLVRHGETDWNRDRRVQGQTDTPLNAAGLAQAEVLASSLSCTPLVAVYSSDLSRARDTAAKVAEVHGLPVQVDVDLREKNFGTWEGLTDREIRERFPHATRGTWGDGETTGQLAERAVRAIGRIQARYASGDVLVISHGGTMRAILAHLRVEHGPIGNCEVFRVAY